MVGLWSWPCLRVVKLYAYRFSVPMCTHASWRGDRRRKLGVGEHGIEVSQEGSKKFQGL